jgi:hypothetical protein
MKRIIQSSIYASRFKLATCICEMDAEGDLPLDSRVDMCCSLGIAG